VAVAAGSVNVGAVGLTIRMLLAFFLAALVWAASLGALVYFVLLSKYWFIALFLLLGFAMEGYEAQGRKKKSKGSRKATRADRARVAATVDRLAWGLTRRRPGPS
jgi:hypothetical protein